MVVYRGNALVGSRLKQLRCDDLFDSQDDAVLAADTNRRATVLDRLDGVFYLEVASIWREDGVEQVVTRSYRGLDGCDAVVSFLGSGCSWDSGERAPLTMVYAELKRESTAIVL